MGILDWALMMTAEGRMIDKRTGKPSETFNSFLYKWTYVPDGRVYVGIHKGHPWDGYNHSSTCEEMNRLFRTEPQNFEREILKRGKYETMQNEEYKILSLDDARNNPKYFNKSNGSPASRGVDRERVKELFEWIRSQKGVLEDADEISRNTSIQIRVADEFGRIHNIKSLIDDNKGNTVETGLCAVLLEEYFEEGEELFGDTGCAILDGNHSTKAVVASKHGKEIPVVRVSLERYKDFSNAEIRLLGNFLNRAATKLDVKSNSDDDLIKMIVTNYDEENIDPMSQECFEILSDLNIDTRNAKSLQKKAAKRIEENMMNMNGKKIRDWTVGENARILKQIIKEHNDMNELAYLITSGSGGSIQSLLSKIMEDLKEDMTNIFVYVRHPLPSYYEDWNTGDKGALARKLTEWCLEKRGVEVKFMNLQHIVEDTKFETASF